MHHPLRLIYRQRILLNNYINWQGSRGWDETYSGWWQLSYAKGIDAPYVQTIVGILLQYPDLLEIVAELLQTYERRAQVGLEEYLDALRINQQRPDRKGQITSGHVIELIQTLRNLYQLPDEDIVYHRGAIVEVLVFKLMSHRYNSGECVSNHRFVDEHGRVITDQVDVAALSRARMEIEGYECKLKANGIESSDCTNLARLVTVAHDWVTAQMSVLLPSTMISI